MVTLVVLFGVFNASYALACILNGGVRCPDKIETQRRPMNFVVHGRKAR